MKRSVMVQIDVDKHECTRKLGKPGIGIARIKERCPFLVYFSGGCWICLLYKETVRHNGDAKYTRLRQCIESEKTVRFLASKATNRTKP